MTLSRSDLVTTGIVLLVLVTVGYGGTFLLKVVTGRQPANDLHRSFFRAGHAHAGVLIVLGLLVKVLVSSEGVPGWSRSGASGVLWAAVLMPAGFFLSVLGRDPEKPNRLVALLWVGAAVLTVGLVCAGVGLVLAGT